MNKEIKDMSASVRARLTLIAKDADVGRNLDSIILNYMQERLLYRLSVSAHVEYFVLKGGLFLYSIHGFKTRPTQDIDFLGRQFMNNADKLKKIFQDN